MTAKAVFADKISQNHNHTAGELLRHTRELKELSQKEVASALNLMVSHIKAIESDRYNPAQEREHFLRYLKEYADLLELDVEKVVQLYSSPVHPDFTYAAKPRRSKAGLIAAAVATLSVAVWQFTPAPLQQRVASTYESVAPAVSHRAEQALEVVKQVSAKPEASIGSGTVQRHENVSLTRVPAAPMAGDEAYASDFIPVGEAGGGSQQFASGDQNDELLFQFEDDCWVEVFDANNKRLFTGRKGANEELYLLGQAPFNVLVGYARGVTLSINGKSVPISLHDYSNSSRLRVALDSNQEVVTEDLALPQTAETSIPPIEQLVAADTGSSVEVSISDSQYQGYSVQDNASVGGKDKLFFEFSDDCWLEVYDSNAEPLVMKTKLAGETLEITGRAPFEVRVGNSSAVKLRLNGKTVPIARHADIRSTELIVGQR
jgi:cytoskeleton protein RodZ